MAATKKSSPEKKSARENRREKNFSPSDQIAVMQSLSQAAAAWLVSLTARRFRDLAAPRNADGSYSAADVLRWHGERVAAESRQLASASTDDVLLVGEETPGLERLRAAKASLAELELSERRGRLIDLELFHAWWVSEVAADVRAAIDVLRQRFGSEAADIIIAAIDRADGTVAAKTSPPSPSTAPTPTAPSPAGGP
jgi:hypothetical protein